MTAIDDILNKLPIDQLASQLGTDPDTIKQASATAIDSLMGGLQQNSSDPVGQRSLAAALKDHTASPLLASDASLDLSKVDPDDGAKIVRHALGADPATAAKSLTGGANAGLVQRLLPMLAPVVLAYLANRLGGQSSGKQQQAQQGGSILDAILGRSSDLGGSSSQDYQRGYTDGYNAARQEQQQQGGMNLGDLIGGLMGGGQPQRQQSSGLGGLLGGLFS